MRSTDLIAAPTSGAAGFRPPTVLIWLRCILLVGLNAGVQGLLVVRDPGPAFTTAFIVRAATSWLAAVLTVWWLAILVTAASRGWRIRDTPWLRAAPWTAGCATAATVGAVVNPLLAPPILLYAVFVVTAAAAGAGHPLTAGFTPFRWAPWRAVLVVAGFAVLVAVLWGAAFASAFFISGPWAALLTWIGFGAAAGLSLWACSVLHRVTHAPSERNAPPRHLR